MSSSLYTFSEDGQLPSSGVILPENPPVTKECVDIAQPLANGLPSDILVYIFQVLQSMTGWHANYITSFPSWIKVTWVCRHWRDVALASPILWTAIRSCKWCELDPEQNWIRTFIERAAHALLDVHISHTTTSHTTLRLAEPHAVRIRHFGFYLNEAVEPEVFDMLRGLVPKMQLVETLTLQHRPKDGQLEAVFPDLSREHLPLLRSLTLHAFHIPWDSSIYSSLRSLDVFSVKSTAPRADLVRILRSCPQLEVLALSRCLGTADEQPSTQFDPILLPKLHTFAITERSTDTSFFCDIISAPSLQKIKVAIGHSNLGAASDPNWLLTLAFAQAVYRPILGRLTELQLDCQEGVAYLIAWTADPDGGLLRAVHVEMQGWDDVTDYKISPRAWSAMLNPLADAGAALTELRLGYPSLETITADMWQRCFTQFPHLRRIRVGYWEGAAVSGFSTFLDQLLETTPSGEMSYCTRLEQLELDGMPINAALSGKLVCLVEQRAAAGIPMVELVFTESYCAKDIDIDKLKASLSGYVKLTHQYDVMCECCRLFGSDSNFRHEQEVD